MVFQIHHVGSTIGQNIMAGITCQSKGTHCQVGGSKERQFTPVTKPLFQVHKASNPHHDKSLEVVW